MDFTRDIEIDCLRQSKIKNPKTMEEINYNSCNWCVKDDF